MPSAFKLLRLVIYKIQDIHVQNNFEWLQDYLNEEDVLQARFKHFDVTITKVETNLKLPHNLTFQPLDVLQTFKTGTANVIFNYDRFDPTNLDISTTASATPSTDFPLRLRFFAGRFE